MVNNTRIYDAGLIILVKNTLRENSRCCMYANFSYNDNDDLEVVNIHSDIRGYGHHKEGSLDVEAESVYGSLVNSNEGIMKYYINDLKNKNENAFNKIDLKKDKIQIIYQYDNNEVSSIYMDNAFINNATIPEMLLHLYNTNQYGLKSYIPITFNNPENLEDMCFLITQLKYLNRSDYLKVFDLPLLGITNIDEETKTVYLSSSHKKFKIFKETDLYSRKMSDIRDNAFVDKEYKIVVEECVGSDIDEKIVESLRESSMILIAKVKDLLN